MEDSANNKHSFFISSSLLLDEPPLIVLPSLAILFGLEAALIMQQLHYLIKINFKANRNIYDGRTWVYNSYSGWQSVFPFLSVKSIQRIFNTLQKEGIVLTGNYNKSAMDRMKWYTINYEKLQSPDFLKRGNACGQIVQMDEAKLSSSSITETTTKTTTTNSSCDVLCFPQSENQDEAEKIAKNVISYYENNGVKIKNPHGLKRHLAKKALDGALEVPEGYNAVKDSIDEAKCIICKKMRPQQNMLQTDNGYLCICCHQEQQLGRI
jgi:hypothetical protein